MTEKYGSGRFCSSSCSSSRKFTEEYKKSIADSVCKKLNVLPLYLREKPVCIVCGK